MRSHVALRVVLVAGLLAVTAAAWFLGFFTTSAGAEGLSRKEMLLGILTLGVFAFAIYGFDLRDWF